jgi:hypothetical protein
MPCDFDAYDGEHPDFFIQRILVSRKEHRCCECYAIIPKNSKYEHMYLSTLNPSPTFGMDIT